MTAEPEPPKGAEERETSRVEAFSDGVMAVIITIMALELKAPASGACSDLAAECQRCWSTS